MTTDEQREREKELQRMARYVETAKRIKECKKRLLCCPKSSDGIDRRRRQLKILRALFIGPLAGREEDDSD